MNETTNGYDLRFHSSDAQPPNANPPVLEVIYSTEAATKTVYFLKDHLGSIRATVLDSAARPVRGHDDYDPWGYPLALRTKKTPYDSLQKIAKNKFTGKEWDDEYGVNWFYFPFRPYDGQIGRWFIVDPLWEKHPEVSPYAYVLNNPLLYIDPDGRQVTYYGTPPPSWAQIKQNFAQRIERSKEYASAGVYTLAAGNLLLAPIIALGEMDAAGISGLANIMTMWGKVAAAGATLADDAARAVSKTANATDEVVSAAEKGTKVFGSLSDGMKASTDDALQKAIDYLGEGYKDLGNGRYISSDGLRQVRMGDADILGKHGGGSHMNFEKLAPNPDKPGRMKVVENKHIFLERK